MFKFLSRNFPHLKSNLRTSQIHNLTRFQWNPLSTASVSNSESDASESENRLFTADYLIQKCGFTRENAVSVSKQFTFQTEEQPDSVISFLKELKLTKSQICKALKADPRVLLCDPEKTLLPKIRYLRALGFSDTDISRTVSRGPKVLRTDLEKRIIPNVECLKGFIESDRKLVDCVRRYPAILRALLQTSVIPNISLLRKHGVSENNIMLFLTNQPRLFGSNQKTLECIVKKVKELGFDPSMMNFMLAVHVLKAMKELTWDKKVEIYKDWGFSEDEILEAFKKVPWFMSTSEKKIMAVMDFLINQMGFKRSLLLQIPGIITFSLQKRIKPRCIIYNELSAKHLVKKKPCLQTMLIMSEAKFRQRVLEHYKAEAPELLDIYNENVSL